MLAATVAPGVTRYQLLNIRTQHRVTLREVQMSDSVYKVVTLIGTSTESWEKAAKSAVEAASKSLRELRIAEVVKQDMVITDGKVEAYRTKVRVSFKYEGNE
jgi:flavin-binding protein dodecin